MIELNRALIETFLDEAVNKFGEDYVYPKEGGLKCSYVRDGEPSCLVGQVLAAAGVPLARLVEADQDNFNSGTPAYDLLQELRSEGVIDFDLRSHVLLTEAQYSQDGLTPWGESVRRAKRAADSCGK